MEEKNKEDIDLTIQVIKSISTIQDCVITLQKSVSSILDRLDEIETAIEDVNRK